MKTEPRSKYIIYPDIQKALLCPLLVNTLWKVATVLKFAIMELF
jgi:hypothetical protein